jgi:hypothetical protein
MTDNELRLQVALALGFDKIRRYNDGRWTGQHDTVEWGLARDNVPDYPNDIAASEGLLCQPESDAVKWCQLSAMSNIISMVYDEMKRAGMVKEREG